MPMFRSDRTASARFEVCATDRVGCGVRAFCHYRCDLSTCSWWSSFTPLLLLAALLALFPHCRLLRCRAVPQDECGQPFSGRDHQDCRSAAASLCGFGLDFHSFANVHRQAMDLHCFRDAILRVVCPAEGPGEESAGKIMEVDRVISASRMGVHECRRRHSG
ncbi:unnamed protein product [Symbiodinium natans]|uniref:Uncharacterized protein n=1 Tax=Symbiodinium natans TaxID=878477 RepID=A0A812NQN9_9DINO|nr:unnamed protein product [Symbiodinium natans]